MADFCLLYKQALYLSIAYIFPKNYMRDWSLSSKVLSWGFYIATKECLVTVPLVLLCVSYLEEIKTIVLCLIWQEQCPPVKFLNHYNYRMSCSLKQENFKVALKNFVLWVFNLTCFSTCMGGKNLQIVAALFVIYKLSNTSLFRLVYKSSRMIYNLLAYQLYTNFSTLLITLGHLRYVNL